MMNDYDFASSRPILQRKLKWLLISALIGVISGCLSALFLIVLDRITEFRNAHTVLIWFLPLAGLAIGLLYHHFGTEVVRGNDLVLEEIHEPKKVIPFRIVPLILGSTWIAHLFGGSVGREGTAVQMGASAADQLTDRLGLSQDDRTTLLMAGMSAGFGSVFGVPFAGTLFGIEVLSIGQIRFRRVFECLVASFIGNWTALLLGVRHEHYVSPELPVVNEHVLSYLLIAGLIFGCVALAFARAMHIVSDLFKQLIKYPPLRPLVGGILVVAGYQLLGTYRYVGLGSDVIRDSLQIQVPPLDWAYKGLFTILTLASGMKGGEVTPLLFIGSTLGNTLSHFVPLSLSLLSALGFVAVFAGASNTPLACTIMAMEIFGPGIGLLALVTCYASWLVSGHHGIYHAQRVSRSKPVPKIPLPDLSHLPRLPRRKPPPDSQSNPKSETQDS